MQIGFSPASGLLTVHAALTTGVHGVTGEICEIAKSQDLSNKTLDTAEIAKWNADNSAVTRIYSVGIYEILGMYDIAGVAYGWAFDGTDFWLDIQRTGKGYLPVHLPNGAIVTAFRVLGQEVSSVCEVALIRNARSLGSGSDMAVVAMTATEEEVSDTSISGGTINNDAYDYLIECDITNAGTETRIRGVQIDYTVTKPQP